MNWFRFYHEALNDPKVQRLPGDEFKAWVNLLCLASQQAERGSLPTVEDCAFSLRCDVLAMADVMQRLANMGLLEREPGGYSIHNWDGRQRVSDDVTKRVQKHRSKVSEDETLQGNEDETLPKRFGNALDKNREETEEKDASASSRAKKPSRATATPETYTPSEIQYEWALTKFGLDRPRVDLETDKFLDHHRAHGSAMKNWDAAWQNWMRRAPEFAPRGKGGAPTQSVDGKAYFDGTQYRRADGLVV